MQRSLFTTFFNQSFYRFRVQAFCLTVVSVLLSPALCRGQEPAQAFVDAMRQNGYFDLTMEYLDRAATSKTVPKNFRQRIPLEKSRTLVQSVSRIRDLEKWDERLAEAQGQLEIYSKNAKGKEAQANAQQEQARLFRYQSRISIMRSESDRLTKAEKEKQLGIAREKLNKALAGYTASRASYLELLKKLRKSTAQTNPAEKAQKNKTLENAYLDSRVNMGAVQELIADTYTAPKKKKEFLQKAVDEYNATWEKFSTRPRGVDACLLAARAHQKLKQYKKALLRVDDIFLFPKGTDFLGIKRKAAVVAADCWNDTTPYPAEEVIEKIEPLVQSLTRRNENHPEWLKVRLALAKAYRTQAVTLKKKNAKPSEVNRLNNQASVLARKVSKAPGPVQEEARALLTEWKIDAPDTPDIVAKDLSLVELKNLARDQATELGEISVKASRLKSQIARGNKDAKLQSDLETTELGIEEQSAKILQTVQLALEKSNAETPRDELNYLRYLQCFAYYSNDQFFEAVIIGEFLLDRYATVSWTQQSAGLVVKSYPKMAAPSGPAGSPLSANDMARLTSVCDRVIKRWPGTPEAVRSADTMARIALRNKDLAAATRYMETIPKDDPARARIALTLGQSLWFEYGRDKTKVPEKLQKTADLLAEGVGGYNKKTLTYSCSLGALLLTKALLEKGEVQQAVDRLESPTVEIAPLDLIKQKHPAVSGAKKATYEKETYKTAIKVYLRAMDLGQPEKWINKLEGVLEGLKVLYEPDGEAGQAQLVGVYKVIATELVTQFNRTKGNDRKTAMAKSVEQFLISISEDAKSARTVLWAGSTMLDMAEQLAFDEEMQSRMYNSAAAALKRATEIGFEGDPQEAQRITELKRQQALAKRGAGNYEEAVDLLADALRDKPSNLKAQVDAAVTLHQWGKASNLSQPYVDALGGRDTYTDDEGKEKTLIWGWKRLGSLTRGKDPLEDTYRQAKLGRIESMYEYGQLTGNQKAIDAAKKEISNLTKRDPEFGGGRWQGKFEELADRINNSN